MTAVIAAATLLSKKLNAPRSVLSVAICCISTSRTRTRSMTLAGMEEADHQIATPRLASRPRLRYLSACFQRRASFGRVQHTMSGLKDPLLPSMYVASTAGMPTSVEGPPHERAEVLEVVCRSEVSKTWFQQLTCAVCELLVSSCVFIGQSKRGRDRGRGRSR